MTTPLDESLMPVVIDLLNRLGKTVKLIRVTSSSYNPDTGAGAKITEDKNIKVTPPSGYPASMIDGDLIREGDVKCFCDSQITPAERDTMIYDGNKFVIVKVSPVYSGEMICGYKIQMR